MSGQKVFQKLYLTFSVQTGSSESSGSESASSYSSSSSGSSRAGRPSKPTARARDKTVIERKVTVKKGLLHNFFQI